MACLTVMLTVEYLVVGDHFTYQGTLLGGREGVSMSPDFFLKMPKIAYLCHEFSPCHMWHMSNLRNSDVSLSYYSHVACY